MNARRSDLWLIILLLASSAARAEYPLSTHRAQLSPPTNEDYYRLYQRRYLKSLGCPGCFGMAAVTPPMVIYFDCAISAPCDPLVHRSFRGQYGLFHPMPYYIPNRLPTVYYPAGRPFDPPPGPRQTLTVLPPSTVAVPANSAR